MRLKVRGLKRGRISGAGGVGVGSDTVAEVLIWDSVHYSTI